MNPTVSPSELLQRAHDVRENAYAPYSGFKVGAAVRSENGDIYVGCNVESSVLGLTQCAERAAITALIASGLTTFTAIAVVTNTGDFPCGSCRQFLAEFNLDAQVHVASDEELTSFQSTTVRQLLPEPFHLNQ
ncbi:MAG: cytidine deaminase [Pirellulaceae bacterium]